MTAHSDNPGDEIEHLRRRLSELERRNAERAPELDLTINAIPVMAWCNNPDGSNEFLNRPWHEYTGVSPEAAHGWGWKDTIHPDDLPELLARYQECLERSEAGETKARLRRFDGAYRWFLFRINPLRDPEGRIVKWYGTNTDIDDLKRYEEELRRSEAFLAEAQRLSLTGSFVWTSTSDELTCSEQFNRIYEFEPSTRVPFSRILLRVHPDDVSSMGDVIRRARRTSTDFEHEHRLLMADGSIKYLHIVAHASRDPQDLPEYIGSVQDITQRRLSEEALGKARAELAHMARIMSLGTLTASIAHEVNQPLSGIVTNANTCLRMLASEPPNIEGARETARRTLRDGERASDVITRLRALYTRKEAVMGVFDLNEATREVIALSLGEWQWARAALRVELAEDLPLVTGDRVQLQQVILNLLRNASDAMIGIDDRPRELVISTAREEGDRVRVAVQDVGIGLNPEESDRLFQAFYTTKKSGMGIGLSVSRSIVENHQGRLWASPNDGPGATFAFSIPRQPTP